MGRGIDHLVLCVRDLEAARETYRALGFTTTPVAHHPWGTANSLVQLQGCFLELLGVADPGKIEQPAAGQFGFGRFNQDFLTRREGFSMLVFQSEDARGDREEFARKGLSDYAPFDFSRTAKLPDGSEARVAFSLAFVTHPAMPEAVFFTCQQHAPQYFWKPDYQRHANGAQVVHEVFMAAERPGDFAGFFEALQGPGSVRREDDDVLVTTPRGRIRLSAPARLAKRYPGAVLPQAPATPHFAGFSIAVTDLAEARAAWSDGGLSAMGPEAQPYLDPAGTHGAIVAFVNARGS